MKKYIISIDALPTALNMLGIAIALIFESRSFIMGYLISLFFVFWMSYRSDAFKKQLIGFVVIIISVLYCLVTFVKVDSSLGRKLIYKISLNIWFDHPFKGIGFGRFPEIFGDYQSAYFAKGQFTEKELLLADNTKHAFNDYLQFVIEGGAMSILVLVLFFLFIFKSFQLAFNKKHNNALLLFASSQIISLGVAALFTHVLEEPWFQLQLTLSILIVIRYAYFAKYPLIVFKYVVVVIIANIIYINFGFYLRNYKQYQSYESAKADYNMGFVTDAVKGYQTVYPFLKSDQVFLSDYATALTISGAQIRAEQIMESVVTIDNSSLYYNKLADCYRDNGKVYEAETAYIRAINMVPNRFIPRYNLFNLYKETKQYEKAYHVGSQILKLPIKIPSASVAYIIQQVRRHIESKKILRY
ncbi:O-antigen ligase family protein [Pedobacter punctiformis]|uniref:O-antigen ligase family protein n=1 Tax=Pedobacter punctiformis TaxID=3004097 RepID=A0ABT4L7B3_9SPHI|nr:O-antigen ligase family protein [Pedobacter sp. HCMS5-2]MCZ4243805.1 O-antigen ligase family protein [Pedobacter sp. HCMS5-2]